MRFHNFGFVAAAALASALQDGIAVPGGEDVHRHHLHHASPHQKHHLLSGHHLAAVHEGAVHTRKELPVAEEAHKHPPPAAAGSKDAIVEKMKSIESKLAAKEASMAVKQTIGIIKVNGPVPKDFGPRFSKEVAKATGCRRSEVKVVSLVPTAHSSLVKVVFEAPADVVEEVKEQVADPDSELVSSELRHYFVAKGGLQEDAEEAEEAEEEAENEKEETEHKDSAPGMHGVPKQGKHEEQHEGKGIDIDTSMPYGDLEPFGREDTAQELTENSVKESDDMIDQLEKAEVAEEKRSVFRALTRLRGVAISSFDAVARAQTGNIDQYAKSHKWRDEHPVHHLAQEEADVAKWAFPKKSD